MVEKVKKQAIEAAQETSSFLKNLWDLLVSLAVPGAGVFAVLHSRNVIQAQDRVNSTVVLYTLLLASGVVATVHGATSLKQFLSRK